MAVGKAIWVLVHSPIQKHMFISELEWILLPPMALKQYRVRVHSGVSVDEACWAHLSDDAETALKAGVRRVRPPKPGPAAPTSGSSTPSLPSAAATRVWRH
ncbi:MULTISPECIES: toxin-activating lysine-acyltransferase [unclassified Minwuia]|uniref:toxin-activating lysine-acyltransferase n=2 Tax=Minwuia TaxID=2493629 RepID=UPI002479CC53|nr:MULTISPECIES: toxin-activating lysine-acyltransferase [unclassified Minwuia]